MILSHSNGNDTKFHWLTVLFALLPGLAFSAPSATDNNFEDERWFQVELIIFAHNNKDALESEAWPTITGISLPENLVELAFSKETPDTDASGTPAKKEPRLVFQPVTQPTTDSSNDLASEIPKEPVPPPVPFEMLPEKELQLNEEVKKLARSSRFESLLHVAWRQPTYDKDRAQTVLLYEGMTEPLPESPDTRAGVKIKKGTKASEPESTDIGPSSPRLVGTVSLSVSRYLHLAADLIYRTPVKERVAVPVSDLDLLYDRPYPTLAQNQGPAYQLEQWNVIHGFRLEESRRMRSKKVHYLDHPFFGIVVLVTPVELPEESEPDRILDEVKRITDQ